MPEIIQPPTRIQPRLAEVTESSLSLQLEIEWKLPWRRHDVRQDQVS
jgi:hypothetical protein